MVTNQAEYERDFDSKGYTFDNPKVLLNPYKVSPLTALVMFETENDSWENCLTNRCILFPFSDLKW